MEYRSVKILIKRAKNSSLCEYLDDICQNYTGIKNCARFHIRQHMTGLALPEDERNKNQKQSIELFRRLVPEMNRLSEEYAKKRIRNIEKRQDLSMEEKQKLLEQIHPANHGMLDKENWYPSYSIMDGIMKLSDNQYYNALPKTCAQRALREVHSEWKSYFNSIKEYKRNKDFTGFPKIPGYQRGGGAAFLRGGCRLSADKSILYFPKTDASLYIGCVAQGREFAEASVMPSGNEYILTLSFQQPKSSPDQLPASRAAAIDIGSKNYATVVNNVKTPPLLIRGKFMSARIRMFEQMEKEDKEKLLHGEIDEDTYHIRIACIRRKRKAFLNDCRRKICRLIVKYCTDNQIGVLIAGRNKRLKEHCRSREFNKDFFCMNFNAMYYNLKILCAESGIEYVETTESYTSKASFFDKDPIPSLQDEIPEFSGKRISRDLYQMKCGHILNADVNGALNILRKERPELAEGIRIQDVSRCSIVGKDAILSGSLENP